jgi:hypothetical protein
VERGAAEQLLQGLGVGAAARVELLAPLQLVALARALGPRLAS